MVGVDEGGVGILGATEWPVFMSSSSHPLRRIAVPAFGPSLLFGIGEGAILPILPLAARELGGSVPAAALMVALMGIGSLLTNLPASVLTLRFGERWAIVAAALWSALGMALCAWTAHLGVFAAGCFMVGMSQAVFLGHPPGRKYEKDGGPGIADALRLLAGSAEPGDRATFALTQLAFWRMAATDGHAKNYSPFCTRATPT